MHVMFAAQRRAIDRVQLSAVAYELSGDVREVHELLQFEERWFDAFVSMDPHRVQSLGEPQTAMHHKPTVGPVEAFTVLFDFCARWMGKRGGFWPRTGSELSFVDGGLNYFVGRTPWDSDRVYDVKTLLMLAQKVPRVSFRAPDVSGAGLDQRHPLHTCVTQAVFAQAAFRALTEQGANRANAALLERLAD